MATAQGFIQPFAQANTPSSVNNGNPATVYNTPQTGAQRPLQGWTIDQPVAANLNLSNTASGAVQQANELIQNNGWVAPQQTNTVQTPKLTVPEGWMPSTAPGSGTAPTTPTPTPTPTTPAPTDTSGWQWVVMNGRVPGMNQQLYNSDPNYKRAWDQAVAEHSNQFNKSYNKDSNAQVIEQRLKDLYSQFSGGSAPAGTGTAGGWIPGSGGGQTAGSNSTQQWVNNLAAGGTPVIDMNKGWAGSTGGDPGKMSEAFSSLASGFTSLGSKVDAGSAMQFLDAITEPFLPGNFYLSELGQVNAPAVLKSVLNQVVPGMGTLASKIAEAIPDSATGFLGKVRDWIKEGKFDELANNVFKGVRKDNEDKVDKGNLDASQRPSVGGGGGGGGGGRGGSLGGGWMYFGGSGGAGHGLSPDISVGEVRPA